MIIAVREIAQRLQAQVESYVRWLLPNGKREGAEWCVGSPSGEEGKSLKVRLTGERAGVWADFAGTDKGDLLDLTSAVRNVSLSEAIKVAKDWLGIRDPESSVPRRSYSKPTSKNVSKPKPESPVVAYLKQQRKLSNDTIQLFRISESNGPNGLEIAFPSFNPAGELVNVKYIALKRDDRDKKIIRQEKGCAPSLFGWHSVKPEIREVVICEGHIDAMTWRQFGFDTLSVPDGTASDAWIDYEWDNLQQFQIIYLAYDNDKPGQDAIAKVAPRLGLQRCLIIRFDKWKDANEALQSGATKEDFFSAIAEAKPITPDEIKSPFHFIDKVIDKFYPPNSIRPGFWPPILDGKIGFRPAELTIWTGISGHGKSVFLSQLMLEAVLCGNKVVIASMEMLGEQTLYRMMCQSEMPGSCIPDCPDQLDREFIGKWLKWLSGRMWIYNLMGNVHTKHLLELMEYSFMRHGVNHFVIDSLMKCSVGSEDYDAQRVFLNELSSFCKEHMIHIHLVAHNRKGKDETERPGKLDVKGSSDIINQADNILTIWRNKEKEEKRYDRALSQEDNKSEPDAIIYCHKQRETGIEFKRKFNFFPKVFRFCPLNQFERLDNLSISRVIEQSNNDFSDKRPYKD